MADDGFHEVQLGKKQLVFAFMAAAVFTVVVFLIGVWVGRDVRRPDADVVADVLSADGTPETPQPATQVAPQELDYAARLQTADAKTEPKVDVLPKPAEPPVPAAETSAPPPAPKPVDLTAKTPPPVTLAKTPAPAAGEWFVQVGAFGTSGPAETLMGSLKKKGYAAYVITEPTGPTPFRVRVGPFGDRAAADVASARLKKEEGLSPLVRR